MKIFFPICICLFAVAQTFGQSVQQPPEVLEAYRVCNEFQRVLAEDLDFDRAFEATFTKDPEKRRAIAIAEGEFDGVDVANVDDATLIGIYKTQAQFIVLLVPMIPASGGDNKAVVFPPHIEKMFKRPKQQESLQSYLVQLKQDLVVFRAHFDKLAETNQSVADRIHELKKGLREPVTPPNHVVKTLTAYSHGHVLPSKAKYYQIANYSVIREAGEMRLIRFRLFDVRW